MPPKVKRESPAIPSAAEVDEKRKKIIRKDVKNRIEKRIAEQSLYVPISNHEDWLVAELNEDGYDVEIQEYGATIWLGPRALPAPRTYPSPSEGEFFCIIGIAIIVMLFVVACLGATIRK